MGLCLYILLGQIVQWFWKHKSPRVGPLKILWKLESSGPEISPLESRAKWGSNNRTSSLEPRQPKKDLHRRPSECTSAIIHWSFDVWTIPLMYEWSIHTLKWSYSGALVNMLYSLWCMITPMYEPFLQCLKGTFIHQSSDVRTCIPMNMYDYTLPAK